MYPITPRPETAERAQSTESGTAIDRAAIPARLLIAYGRFLFRYRNIGFPIVAILLLAAFEPGRSTNARHEILVDMTGFALAAIGQAIHIVTLGTVWIKRGGHDRRPHADELVTSGCYAHCRNPIYIGNFLVIAGLLIMFNNIATSAVTVVFIAFSYCAIVIAEERYLAQRFGAEYQSYCQRVPRWLPILKGLPTTIRSAPIDWGQAVAKAYTSIYSWIILTVSVLTYKAWLFRGLGSRPEWVGLAATFGSCTLLFLLARWIKKRVISPGAYPVPR